MGFFSYSDELVLRFFWLKAGAALLNKFSEAKQTKSISRITRLVDSALQPAGTTGASQEEKAM